MSPKAPRGFRFKLRRTWRSSTGRSERWGSGGSQRCRVRVRERYLRGTFHGGRSCGTPGDDEPRDWTSAAARSTCGLERGRALEPRCTSPAKTQPDVDRRYGGTFTSRNTTYITHNVDPVASCETSFRDPGQLSPGTVNLSVESAAARAMQAAKDAAHRERGLLVSSPRSSAGHLLFVRLSARATQPGEPQQA